MGPWGKLSPLPSFSAFLEGMAFVSGVTSFFKETSAVEKIRNTSFRFQVSVRDKVGFRKQVNVVI